MFRKESFGKLIISRSNNYYETFHNLNFILVKYDKNAIIINHRIGALVIDGDYNKVEIGELGNIEKIVINGDYNLIIAKKSFSLNNVLDNGQGNIIEEENKAALDSEEEEKDEESQENEENEYEEEEKDGESQENEENEYEEEEKNNRYKYRIFNEERPILLSLNNKEKKIEAINEDSDDEDNDDNIYDIYGGEIDYFTLLEIDSQLKMQLRREKEKELFRSSLIDMIFNNSYNNKDSEVKNENDILAELIDINFKSGTRGVKKGNEKCVICCENFKENEKVKMTECFHIFHFNCIKKWIESKKKLEECPDCPICQRNL